MQAAHTPDGDRSLVPGVSPEVYNAQDFERIAEFVRREAGIVLSEKKQMLAYSRLAPLVRKSGLQTFCSFLDQVEQDRTAGVQMVAAMTTNHTYFYREPHHFEHFEREIRPALVEQLAAGRAVRMWSAGCSSGEEVWTLLMVLLGENRAAGLQLANRDLVVLATDIADHAIQSAQTACYPAKALDPMPESLRANWSRKDPGDAATLTIAPELLKLVRFRKLNLLRPWPFASTFDVIFCRNVMIYFDGPSKEQLVLALARQLRPGGHLYIGHSERVSGEAVRLLDAVGPTVYRRRDA